MKDLRAVVTAFSSIFALSDPKCLHGPTNPGASKSSIQSPSMDSNMSDGEGPQVLCTNRVLILKSAARTDDLGLQKHADTVRKEKHRQPLHGRNL